MSPLRRGHRGGVGVSGPMDRRRAIARILRAGAAVTAAGTIPVLVKTTTSTACRVRLGGTRIRIRIVKLDPKNLGPGSHLAG